MAASCSQLYKILHCKRIKKTRPVLSDEYINLFQCRLCIKYTYIYVQNCLLLSLSTGHVRRMTFFCGVNELINVNIFSSRKVLA